MVTGLPSADSLLPSIATLQRQLASEEATYRSTVLAPATSTDGRVTAVANGMVEVTSVTIVPSAYPAVTPAAITALAASIKDACGKAVTNANANTKPRASTAAAGYTLAGIPNANQPAPATPGFASSDADVTAQLRAQDPIISAKQFQGISGAVSAIVDGGLNLVSITLTAPLPALRPVFEHDVLVAMNVALEKAKNLFEDGIKTRVDSGVDSSAVTFPTACLWAQGNLALADRVKIKKQDGTFAPIVNAGATGTNVGADAQTGDLWSRAAVELRDRAKVTGNLKTMSTLTLRANASVSGLTTQNGMLLQIPHLGLSVTFPGTNQGNKTVAPNGTLTLAPGAYADVTVNAGATLFLSTGTYFMNSLDIEPNAKISCTSSSGQIVVNIKTGFIFRGAIVEKTGSARPKLFVGMFGTSSVPIEGPFTGTLVALAAPITLATINPTLGAHSGAFYAKDITVNPDNTITHFPFSGPPTPTST
jgi:DNA-binding protein YbaB